MGENIGNQLEDLANKGSALKEKGYSKHMDPCPEEVRNWYRECNLVINAILGKKTDQARAFRRTQDLPESVSVLKALSARAQDSASKKTPTFQVSQHVNQITNVSVDISNQINLFIEYSVPANKRQEVKNLFNEVKAECEKPETNWTKVTELLKKSFDYGLKIAPELVKLAAAYFNAKGGI
ncbi:MAG: hypothetical protein ACOX0F_13685 [Syntrophomonadaceae bacterium]